MTLKQEQAILLLPKNDYNVAKSMIDAGYTPATAYSGGEGSAREGVLKLARKAYFDEEFVKKQYKKTLKQTNQVNDFTNKLRTLEGMARIMGMFTDKTENKTAITVEEQRKLVRDGLQELLNVS